jgi:hypothetical protein
MLRRLETMVLMTGYQLPLRAIREQMASAVDLIVHTARLKDGTRKIVNITEVYGIEDDEILTQDIFTFIQTGYHDGKIEGTLQPTGVRPTFMSQFQRAGVTLPPGEYGIPPEDPANPIRPKKTRFGAHTTVDAHFSPVPLGDGRAVVAGGMVYVSSIGPVDPGVAWPTSAIDSRASAARWRRSSGRTGRSRTRPISTSSTRSGCAGSRPTPRSAR